MQERFESAYTGQELSDSMKKALIGIQSRIKASEGRGNQLDTLIQLGNTQRMIVKDNNTLIKETIQTILEDTYNNNYIVFNLRDALNAKSETMYDNQSVAMTNLILMQIQEYLSSEIENLDVQSNKGLRQDAFL